VFALGGALLKNKQARHVLHDGLVEVPFSFDAGFIRNSMVFVVKTSFLTFALSVKKMSIRFSIHTDQP